MTALNLFYPVLYCSKAEYEPVMCAVRRRLRVYILPRKNAPYL
jgi:hypothetical protein